MPKTTKNASKFGKKRQPQELYALHPWQCRHHAERSELLAYVEANGQWQPVAIVPSTLTASARALAAYIAAIVNEHHRKADLLHEAMTALELCLEDDHLTFASEQAADRVITRIKARVS